MILKTIAIGIAASLLCWTVSAIGQPAEDAKPVAKPGTPPDAKPGTPPDAKPGTPPGADSNALQPPTERAPEPFKPAARPPQKPPSNGDDVMERYRWAEHHAGNDRTARTRIETVSKTGKKRIREFIEVRWSGDPGGKKWFYYYMFEPKDVTGLSVLIANDPDKRDDRWGYLPKLNLVRKFEAVDELQTFLGSEFTYEDAAGRDRGLDSATIVREEKLGEMDCYVVESVPKGRTVFSKRVFWIDKKTFLSPKFEYYDLANELWRRVESNDLEAVTTKAGLSYPTFKKRTVTNLRTGSKSEMVLQSVRYDQGLQDSAFVPAILSAPPTTWIVR